MPDATLVRVWHGKYVEARGEPRAAMGYVY